MSWSHLTAEDRLFSRESDLVGYRYSGMGNQPKWNHKCNMSLVTQEVKGRLLDR